MSRGNSKVHFVPVYSSERIHKIIIEDERDADLNGLRMIALKELGRILKINMREFQSNSITYRYTKSTEKNGKYQYFLRPIGLKFPKTMFYCYSLLCNPPTVASLKPIKKEKYKIPKYLKDLFNILLDEKMLKTQRIFIESSPKMVVENLRRSLITKKLSDINMSYYTPHDYANVLMLHLEQLEESLFLPNFYPAYKRIAELEITLRKLEMIHEKQLSNLDQSKIFLSHNSDLKYLKQQLRDAIQLIVHLMPTWKRDVLKSILEIMNAAYLERKYNGLKMHDLSMTFSRLFFCPQSMPQLPALSHMREMANVVVRMIKMGQDVFDAPVTFRNEVWNYSRQKHPKKFPLSESSG